MDVRGETEGERHGKQRFLTQWIVFYSLNCECRKRTRFVPDDNESHFGCFEIEDFHSKVKWQKLKKFLTNPEYEIN